MSAMQDIPKLYTAFAEWLSCVVIIMAQRKNSSGGSTVRAVSASGTGLIALCMIQSFCGRTDGLLWLLGMGAAVFVMYGMLRASLSGSSKHIWFLTARAFIRAEWIAALEWQLDRYFVPQRMENTIWFSVAFCLISYLVLTTVFLMTERYFLRSEKPFDRMDITWGDVARIWFFVLSFFAFSNMSYVKIASPFRGNGAAEIFHMRALADLAGVIMVELMNIEKHRSDRRQEEAAIRSVLYAQYQQFRQSQENMDLINRKYHDLKHQLQVLRAENDSGSRLKYLDEMEGELRFYEAEMHTGNTVLDTILTDKSRACLQQNIQMTVVADGSILNHIHVMDLATIFGNALDNAIEHEIQISDPEKRMVRVSVAQRGSMGCIMIENFFEGELQQNGDEYMTTKADHRYHGYGLKSIRYAVEKYSGVFSAGVEDGWFRVKILLPGNGST